MRIFDLVSKKMAGERFMTRFSTSVERLLVAVSCPSKSPNFR